MKPHFIDDSALITNGTPLFGHFRDSLSNISINELRQEDPFGKPYGALRRWAGFKQFQYFGGINQQYLFGCALADLRYVAAVFCYVYDINKDELITRSFRVPFGMGLSMNDNPVTGSSYFSKGRNQVRMDYLQNPRSKSLHVQLDNGIEINAEMNEDGFEPMSLCTRAGYSGWVYANKTAGKAVTGDLTIRGQKHDLAQLGTYGHHDFSCGFMRRETFWNWACLSGKDGDGKVLGLRNL